MSSTTDFASATSSVPSFTTSPSPSPTNGNRSGNSPSSFYRNLFYILIGLLCAFGLVSFLSLMRARRRRHAILREAERLGVLVPGLDGYIPLRERRHLGWTKADGSQHPDWWEVEKALVDEDRHVRYAAGEGESSTSGRLVEKADFCPLAVIPPRPPQPAPLPVLMSDLPFFPNHLAYRPESLFVPTSQFANPSDSKVLDGLVGGKVDLVTVIRMPMPLSNRDRQREPEEGEEVIEEWGGVELGIVEVTVVPPGETGWRQ
ncbi:hypothetical protein IAU60_000991 [Kwoniella sp. DSM 27419]